MNKFLLTGFALLGAFLAACDEPPPPPPPSTPAEVAFATAPSVLRGNWIASISRFPDKNSLQLQNIVATCEVIRVDLCERYTFEGTFQQNDETPVPISGTGNSGTEFIYTLTSPPPPPPPPSIRATFSLNDTDWVLEASFHSNFDSSSPAYQGWICEASLAEKSCPNPFAVTFTPG